MTSLVSMLYLMTWTPAPLALPAALARAHHLTSDEAIVVPFEILASKHMAVQIMVNGQGPFRVIFDTGAPFTLLSNKVSKQAKITFTKNQGRANPMMMAGSYTVDELQMGEASVKKMPVMVMDHPTVMAIARFVGPIEGLLGFPFFARFRTTIDYQAKTMTMIPVVYEPGNVLQDMTRMLMAPKNQKVIKTLGSGGLWGFDVAKQEGDEEAGIDVVQVWPDSPAATAGLKKGDRLLTLDGTWTESSEDTWRAASQVRLGQPIEMTVRRNGEDLKLTLTPREGL